MGFWNDLFVNTVWADTFGLEGFERDLFFALHSGAKQEKRPSSRKQPEKDRIVIRYRKGQATEALDAAKNFPGRLISFELIEDEET